MNKSRPYEVLYARGQLIDLSSPKVMGIVNLTDDSFYASSRVKSEEQLIHLISSMVADGVDIIDIGAMSSRPGAEIISEDIELQRLSQALEAIRRQFPKLWISVDTMRADIVHKLVPYDIQIVNDISGGTYDSNMYKVCASHRLAYIMMHMQGLPSNMQEAPTYKNVVSDILSEMWNRIKKARRIGLQSIVLDVGFGFGKTVEHNYDLLSQLSVFEVTGCPLLVGLSRKSMIYKPLGITQDLALNGTTALHMAALLNGASILRVHDVKEAKEVVKLFRLLTHKGQIE